MKKFFSKLGEFFGALFGIVITVLLGVFFVILIPIDYIRYKCSPYYKLEHKKYKLYAGSGINFELYNEIAKNQLPIKYIHSPHDDSLCCGWFIYNDTLIIPNAFAFEYNTENKSWNYCCENIDDDGNEKRVLISLDEYIDSEIQEANELAKERICNDAVVLIESSYIENIDVAIQEKRFLIYDSNREAVLKAFCNIEV